MSRRAARIAVVIGIAMLVVALSFHHSVTDGGAGTAINRYELGLPSSPWFRYEKEHSKKEYRNGPTVGYTESFNDRWSVEILNWSMACLIGSFALLLLSTRLRLPRGTG